MGLALFHIWRRCWAGEQGGQEDQEGQRIGDTFDTVDGFSAGAGMVSSGAGVAERSDGLALFPEPAPVLEGGQEGQDGQRIGDIYDTCDGLDIFCGNWEWDG
jgi:hypothetical protein